MSKRKISFDLPIHVEITKSQAKEFNWSFRSTLSIIRPSVLKDLYIYSSDKEAIVISYDGKWRPFICQTRGYNDPSYRIPIYLTNEVLDTIEVALKKVDRNTPGGRTFLNSNGALCIDEGMEIEIVQWNWPLGDIVNEIRKIRADLL